MELLDRAIAELDERNFGSAVRTLEMLTAQDPMNAEAWKHLARACHGAGEKQQAADAAQRYAALRPADAGGHYNAGVLLMQIGQRDAAERAIRAALTADPAHAKARRALHKLTEETPAPSPAVAFPQPAPAERRGMPWQGKVAAALTVLASLAIVAWLFLPGGPAYRGLKRFAPQPSPAGVTTPPAEQPDSNTPSVEQAPLPNQPQVQPQDQGAPTPSPTAERPPIQPMPEVKNPDQAAPAARQVWRQLWQRPLAQNPQQNQYSQPGLPIPQEVLAAAGNASGQGSAAPESGAGTGPTGQAPGAQGAPGAASAPRSAPQPARPAQPAQPQQPQATQPQPLFTPDEARRVADAIDNAERQEIEGTLGYLANWLRHDPACNDEDFWPILQTALATTGPAMAPQGLTFGVAEVMASITNADNAWQAADNIEAQSRNLRGALPQGLKLQIAQVLANSTSAEQAYLYVDTVLRQNNTAVSNYATQVLMDAVRKAEREKARIEARGR